VGEPELWGPQQAFNAIGEWRHSMECCRKGLALAKTMSDLRLKVGGLFRRIHATSCGATPRRG